MTLSPKAWFCEEYGSASLVSWPWGVCSLFYSWVSSEPRSCLLAFLEARPDLRRSGWWELHTACAGSAGCDWLLVKAPSAYPAPNTLAIGFSTRPVDSWGLALGWRWYPMLARVLARYLVSHQVCFHSLCIVSCAHCQVTSQGKQWLRTLFWSSSMPWVILVEQRSFLLLLQLLQV